jgi:hypothetical protein
VGEQERRSLFRQIGIVLNNPVNSGDAVFFASIPKMTEVVLTKVPSVGSGVPYTVRNNEVMSYEFLNRSGIELRECGRSIPI